MITIREVSEQDLTRLADYLRAQSPFIHTTKEIWERRFDTWWASNPAFTSKFPRGWILENDTSLLGFIGNVPVKFIICGEEKTAVAAVTWYVDPSVRGLASIGLFNKFLKQKDADLFLFNTNSQDLMTILQKNKFQKFVLPKYQKKYFVILNKRDIKYILLRSGIFKIVGDSSSLRSILNQFVSLIFVYLREKPVSCLSPTQEKEYTSSLCASCDDTFSEIWRSASDSCGVTMSRDVKTLNWIYFSPIEPSRRIVIQCRRNQDNSLVGYMVFDIRRKRPLETAVMKLMDMCIERNDPNVITSLLQFATETAKQNNVPLVELWAVDDGTETYLKSNFKVSRATRHHNFIRLSDSFQPRWESLTVFPSMIAPPRGTDHF